MNTTVIIYYDYLVGVYDDFHDPVPMLINLLKQNNIYDEDYITALNTVSSIEDIVQFTQMFNVPMYIYRGPRNTPQNTWRLD